MAVKTQAQLLAQVASLLADNTTGDISALDVRTCLNDIIDSASYGGTKVYKALLTQTGTSAPVATVLVNTLGGTPTFGYNGIGLFSCTATGLLTLNKTAVSFGNHISVNDVDQAIITAQSLSINGFDFSVYNWDTNAFNGILNNTLITIEVYP